MRKYVSLVLAVSLIVSSGVVALAAPRQSDAWWYCIVEAVPADTERKPAPMRCYASQTAAEGSVPATSVTLGKLYDYTNGGGTSITITGSSCNNYGVSDLRAYGFNDLTTSLDNYCGHISLYTALNYTGSSQTYGNGRTNYVGDAMNNQTTSLVFKL